MLILYEIMRVLHQWFLNRFLPKMGAFTNSKTLLLHLWMKKLIDRLIVGVFDLIKTCWNLQKSKFFAWYYALDRFIFHSERIDNFHLPLSTEMVSFQRKNSATNFQKIILFHFKTDKFPGLHFPRFQNNAPSELKRVSQPTKFSMQSIITLDGLSNGLELRNQILYNNGLFLFQLIKWISERKKIGDLMSVY